jgi:hypothetical protein
MTDHESPFGGIFAAIVIEAGLALLWVVGLGV